MSFEDACRKADAEERRKPVDPVIARARRLMADHITLEHAWAVVQHPVGKEPEP